MNYYRQFAEMLGLELEQEFVLTDVKGIFVKDFTPKYSTIELLEYKETFPFAKPIGFLPFKKVKKDYGNRKILSVMDFNDTHSTSIIIEQKGKQKRERQKNG